MSVNFKANESNVKAHSPEPIEHVFKVPQAPLSGPKRKKEASSKETESSLNERKIEDVAMTAIAQVPKKKETSLKKVKREDCNTLVSERTGKAFHPDTLKYFEEMKKKMLADMEKRHHDHVTRINEKWQEDLQNQNARISNSSEEKNV